MDTTIKRYNWKVTNKQTQEAVLYGAAAGKPVTAKHVKAWLNGDACDVSCVDTLPEK